LLLSLCFWIKKKLLFHCYFLDCKYKIISLLFSEFKKVDHLEFVCVVYCRNLEFSAETTPCCCLCFSVRLMLFNVVFLWPSVSLWISNRGVFKERVRKWSVSSQEVARGFCVLGILNVPIWVLSDKKTVFYLHLFDFLPRQTFLIFTCIYCTFSHLKFQTY
jgi:uncharacterized membrane protein